ncbi:respiratory chain complex I subunit 1 family protein [Sulfurospirillum barnesii]|uniref:Formate hydrogenlyase subunit 4 n=1 Tax=Sulfurospirillum barnesii (strain ATCC 700032 / DSM 10660 / SES-3) TaxID=760154 RepID=I3XZ64_SULBS|nr:complex I subunit 1 family protein [Sulfurospirillum barnesii]AFL69238.1 formate hydrogenlyase subunit 4 [Sulfurospirillum barnesii SES-3]
MDFFYLLLQLISAIMVAPLFDGISRKLRAKFQSRMGPSIFQTYYDIYKLLKRGRTKSHSASYIYQIAPYVLFISAAAMFCALPITYGTKAVALSQFSDIFVLLYLGALFRFTFIVAGFDTANPFSGVSASREGTMGFYTEEVAVICLIVVMMGAGSTNLPFIVHSVLEGHYGYAIPSFSIAATAFLWVMYVETGRKPYDLAEAEQELQEGVLGEFCGKDFALIDIAILLKQFAVLGFFLVIFVPWGIVENPILSLIIFLAEVGFLYVMGVFIDNFGPRFTMNKGMKRTMLYALAVSCTALVLYIMGI